MTWQKMELNKEPHAPTKDGSTLTWKGLMEATEGTERQLTKAQAKKLLRIQSSKAIWTNDLYRVTVNPQYNKEFKAEIVELSITRMDKKPIHNWRHFQLIKNDVLGEDIEAIEIYPNEARLMDTANTYWLYGFPKGYTVPFGFMVPRNVSTPEESEKFGAVQEPL